MSGSDPRRPPLLSVIVIVYDMRREARRTLLSLSASYQHRIDPRDYEVLVVENGSPEPLDPEAVRSLGPNFRYFFVEDASPSPAAAVNFGASQARGEYLGVLIDGARIVTPGMLQLALDCLRGFPRAVVGTLGFHLGPDVQIRAHLHGYDRRVEDENLAGIDWPADGYRLFEIAALAASSREGWFVAPFESNCIFLARELFDEAGGCDEAFDLPGGGLVNLDLYSRLCRLPSSPLITLLGEASFHQIHGGAATGLSEDALVGQFERWAEQYARIRGEPPKAPEREPLLIGQAPAPALPWIVRSCELLGAGQREAPATEPELSSDG